MDVNTIICGDCLDILPTLVCKVDMVMCDPPYGTTACKWDSIIPLGPMWEQLRRLIKPNGAIVMTASQPFTTTLIASNMKMFKYCWVWEKNKASNIFAVKYAPMKKHEDVVVFYSEKPVFNRQFIPRSEAGKARTKYVHNPSNTGKRQFIGGFKQTETIKYDESQKNPESIIYFNNERGLHPTQKPVALMEYLIKTYTNEGETVLDFAMGSGTTGVACRNLGRNFIGIDISPEYCDIARKRLEAEGKGLTVKELEKGQKGLIGE